MTFLIILLSLKSNFFFFWHFYMTIASLSYVNDILILCRHSQYSPSESLPADLASKMRICKLLWTTECFRYPFINLLCSFSVVVVDQWWSVLAQNLEPYWQLALSPQTLFKNQLEHLRVTVPSLSCARPFWARSVHVFCRYSVEL